MNINDVEEVDEVQPEDYLKAIFEKQHKLALKYLPIEEKSGLLQTTDFPVDLNDPHGQARLKDLAWRTVEELGEAMECIQSNPYHFYEELIDGLHFFIELLMAAGMTHKDFDPLHKYVHNVKPSHLPIDVDKSRFTTELSLAMNCLKNKPWKQTHMETDKLYFQAILINAFRKLITLFVSGGMDAKMIYEYYFKKNKVNQFRQRSNY